MPKLPSSKGIYIPKIRFQDDNGTWMDNSEFPPGEQVKCDLTYPGLTAKDAYTKSYVATAGKKDSQVRVYTDNHYDIAIKKHVKKIENLFTAEGKPVENGADLVAWVSTFADELKQDLFHRIMGIRIDTEDEDDGPGELTPGENKA